MSNKGSIELYRVKAGGVYPRENGLEIPPKKYRKISENEMLRDPEDVITIPVGITRGKVER